MSRPINANADSTRRRILEQAVRLFSANGVGETSIREIARAAGVSLAMVHHYYLSKEGLLHACIESVFADLTGLQEQLERVVASATSGEDLLRQATLTGFRFARSRRELARLLVRLTIARGSVPTEAEPMIRAMLDLMSEQLALLTGRRPADLRLPLQSVILLIEQYAVDDAGFIDATFDSTSTVSIEVVEAHLLDSVQRILGLDRSENETNAAANKWSKPGAKPS